MGAEMEFGAQTIPEYARELVAWLEAMAGESHSPKEGFILRYVAEHIAQDIPGLERDQSRRESVTAPYTPCVLNADGRCTRWAHRHVAG